MNDNYAKIIKILIKIRNSMNW